MTLIALNESIPMPKAVKSCRKTYKSVTETHTHTHTSIDIIGRTWPEIDYVNSK